MGFFFRRSARIGPFRLNFSRTGVGASVGVKGARLTITPRSTTYITVGRNGFYYRETFSGRGGIRKALSPSALPIDRSGWVDIPTADATTLVDSSSKAFVERLNERARMFNPAWLLYGIAPVLFLIGISSVPTEAAKSPTFLMNGDKTYEALVAHYGYPNSVIASNPLGLLPVRTALYTVADTSGLSQPFRNHLRIATS